MSESPASCRRKISSSQTLVLSLQRALIFLGFAHALSHAGHIYPGKSTSSIVLHLQSVRQRRISVTDPEYNYPAEVLALSMLSSSTIASIENLDHHKQHSNLPSRPHQTDTYLAQHHPSISTILPQLTPATDFSFTST